MGVVRRVGVVEVEDLDSGKEQKAALAEGCAEDNWKMDIYFA